MVWSILVNLAKKIKVLKTNENVEKQQRSLKKPLIMDVEWSYKS